MPSRIPRASCLAHEQHQLLLACEESPVVAVTLGLRLGVYGSWNAQFTHVPPDGGRRQEAEFTSKSLVPSSHCFGSCMVLGEGMGLGAS